VVENLLAEKIIYYMGPDSSKEDVRPQSFLAVKTWFCPSVNNGGTYLAEICHMFKSSLRIR